MKKIVFVIVTSLLLMGCRVNQHDFVSETLQHYEDIFTEKYNDTLDTIDIQELEMVGGGTEHEISLTFNNGISANMVLSLAGNKERLESVFMEYDDYELRYEALELGLSLFLDNIKSVSDLEKKDFSKTTKEHMESYIGAKYKTKNLSFSDNYTELVFINK